MKVKLKVPTIDAIQYLGEINVDDCIDLIDHPSLSKSIGNNLLHLDASTNKYSKVADGTWLVKEPSVGFMVIPNAKFWTLYEML